MKFNTRISIALNRLIEIACSYSEKQLNSPVALARAIREWVRPFILPLYPKSPKNFIEIKFLLETPDSEIPVTQEGCLCFLESVKKFVYRDRNDFICSVAYLINKLVILRHPEWLDSYEGDYEYYYCFETDEIVLLGQFTGTITLDGTEWKENAMLLPAKRSVLVKAGLRL
ncbi:MAG: hypothetical protein NVSMB70_08710 [Chamaesiphon sp.]